MTQLCFQSDSWKAVILCLQLCLSTAPVAHKWMSREENHIWKMRITTVFVQSWSHTHSFTKAAIVKEKQRPQQKLRPYTSSKKNSICMVHKLYMVALPKSETCCHLLRLWASCLKNGAQSSARNQSCRRMKCLWVINFFLCYREGPVTCTSKSLCPFARHFNISLQKKLLFAWSTVTHLKKKSLNCFL